MAILGQIIGLGSLICLILFLVQVFKRNGAGSGILWIVLTIVTCGIAPLIYGWMKANEWGIKNIMMIWTACFVVSFIISLASGGIHYSFHAGTP